MSLNDYSPIASLRTPAVPVVFLQTLSKPHTRFCYKCSLVLPKDFPWTACDDCQLDITRLIADVPAPGQTLRVNQDVANLEQYGRILSTCASCLIAFEVPRSNSTLYRDSVCNACQIQQEGTKLKSTGRNNAIATTSHPPPPPYTFPDIRDPPYPSFFDSCGELVASPTVTAPRTVPPVSVTPVRVCMRYGCGVSLRPGRLLDFCNDCMRSGFGCGLPSSLKHHLKRIKRDELSSVTLTSRAKRDIDTTQRNETLLLPRKFLELSAGSDDLDLELIYPEDEELTAQNCVDSTAKMVDEPVSCPDPTLGPGRPMLLPLAITTSPRSPNPKPSKRACGTPGCGGTVSPSATWQRCYKCSLQRWKEHQQAAIATSAIVGPASPAVSDRECTSKSGEAMDGHKPASLEATAVDQASMSRESEAASSHSQTADLNAIDRLSLSNDREGVTDSGGARRTPSTFNIECDRDSGMEPEPTIPEWDSDLTDLSSEDESLTKRDSDSDGEDSSMITIRIPVLASRLPSGSNVRVCAIKRCNIVLSHSYRWKICESCRRYQRGYQRIRMEKARRRIEGLSHTKHQSADFRNLPQPEIPLMEIQHNEKNPEVSRLCAVPRCRTRLPERNYRWKCCQACRTRARDNARRSSVGRLIDLEGPVGQSSSLDISSYPTFQNRSVLFLEFSAMLGQFIEAQILYLRVMLQTAGEKVLSRLDPVLFTFDGQYSTVTGQRGHQDIDEQGNSDPEKSQEAVMQKDAASVVEELNGSLLTEFKPLKSFLIESGGFIARYNCALELIVPLRPIPEAKDSKDTDIHMPSESDTSLSHVPYMKPMSGELEVAVVPDDSHRLLLGRRTIIRFRMLG